MTRLLTLISGVVALVLPNVGSFNLPVATQTGITVVGGALLSILAWLEHPTSKAAATSSNVVATPVVTPPPPSSVKTGA